MHKVMLIDNDTTGLAIGRAFLEDEYELLLARSGMQALGALKGAVLPEVVLLELQMPGLDGMGVLKELKSDERLKEIPVIFLADERDNTRELQCYAEGAAELLQKPVNRTLLKIKIEQQLSYVALKRENEALKSKRQLLSKQGDVQ